MREFNRAEDANAAHLDGTIRSESPHPTLLYTARSVACPRMPEVSCTSHVFAGARASAGYPSMVMCVFHDYITRWGPYHVLVEVHATSSQPFLLSQRVYEGTPLLRWLAGNRSPLVGCYLHILPKDDASLSTQLPQMMPKRPALRVEDKILTHLLIQHLCRRLWPITYQPSGNKHLPQAQTRRGDPKR